MSSNAPDSSDIAQGRAGILVQQLLTRAHFNFVIACQTGEVEIAVSRIRALY